MNIVLIVAALFNAATLLAAPPPRLSAVIVQEYPHDPAAFTQGLVWDKGIVYESTGLNGQSSLRRIELVSGKIVQQYTCEHDIFAEGATVFGDSIYQLTWKNRVIFQYDKRNFAMRHTWSWPNEGWGITHDNSSLIISDGTATLYFLHPQSMTEQRRLTVHDGEQEIRQLNELEYINGAIYANIWQKCQIAIINPHSGSVMAWLDLSAICAQMQNGNAEAVLNGIMYDAAQHRLFVTGKLWHRLFEIKVPGELQVRQMP